MRVRLRALSLLLPLTRVGLFLPCGPVTGWVSGTCSSVSQQPYDFSKIIARYTG